MINTNNNTDNDDLASLFVFGTLRKGFCNHDLISTLSSYSFAGYGVTEKRFKMISFGGFPGIVKFNVDKWPKDRFNRIRLRSVFAPIEGEVYRVPFNECILNATDHLEGHPDFFKREVQQIKLHSSDEVIDSYIYVLNNAGGYYDNLQTCPPIQLNLEEGTFDWCDYVIYPQKQSI